MFTRLLLICILVPLLEIALLIEIGSRIGTLYTILWILSTGILGVSCARLEALRIWRNFVNEIRGGRMPSDILFDTLFIGIGAVLLILPGFILDVVGLCLIIPPSRKYIIKKIQRSLYRSRKITIVKVV